MSFIFVEWFIAILIVIVIYLISRLSKMPYYIDPYGEQSIRLTNRHSKIYWLASHIVSFLTLGKYKCTTSTLWRAKKIIEEADRGICEPLEIKFTAGEAGKGMRESIRLALEKGFKVILLTGSPYCDAVDEIKEFIKNSKFELYINVEHRPERHFAIIANKHIFLEVPHTPYQEKKFSLGINNAKTVIVDSYTEKFNKVKDEMQKITSVKEFEEIESEYCLIPPQKDKSWWEFRKKRKVFKVLHT